MQLKNLSIVLCICNWSALPRFYHYLLSQFLLLLFLYFPTHNQNLFSLLPFYSSYLIYTVSLFSYYSILRMVISLLTRYAILRIIFIINHNCYIFALFFFGSMLLLGLISLQVATYSRCWNNLELDKLYRLLLINKYWSIVNLNASFIILSVSVPSKGLAHSIQGF